MSKELKAENERLLNVSELLREENELLRECIEWIAKNATPCVTITKRTNGLYDCRIKEEVGEDE